MQYVRIGQTDRIELVVEDGDEVYAEVTPSGRYRVYHHKPQTKSHTHTDLYVIPQIQAKTLRVVALSGLFIRPTWQLDIPVRPEDEPVLLQYAGEEQQLTVRDVDNTDYTVTLADILRMQYAQGIIHARMSSYRANMSDRTHMMHGIYDWLVAAWERYQLATGMAREFRRVSPGMYDDPYMNTCQPLPEGWATAILAHRSRISQLVDEYEMRADRRPKPDDFWPQWHAGWETDILPTLQIMAGKYGWTRVHNPRSIADPE